MENGFKKRKRSSNWTPEMVELLISVIKPVAEVIDSKLNSLSMIKKKSEAWECIKKAFEANGYQVTTKQIKDQWSRRKQLSRSRISEFKRSQRETGGGSPPKEPDDLDYEIEEIAKDDFLEDLSAYDGDALYGKDETENELPNELENLVKKTDSLKPAAPLNDSNKIPIPKRTTANKKRIFPTTASSEELLRKRIVQVEDETKAKKNIFQLKEKKERIKIQVQKRKLCLLNMQIRHYENNL